MNNEAHLKTWNTYQAAWGPVSEAERRELLTRSVSDMITYTDPASQVQGVRALAERIVASQARFPGCRFQNDSFLEHHDQALFHWTMYDVEGAVFVKDQASAGSARTAGSSRRLASSKRPSPPPPDVDDARPRPQRRVSMAELRSG